MRWLDRPVKSRALAWISLAQLGCAIDPTSDTTNADPSGSSSESESGETGASESESGETGEPSACIGCAESEYCYFPDGLCGAGEPGQCEPKLGECWDNPVHECGCDGMIYMLGCAAVAGVDRHMDASACTVAPEEFPCGPWLCNSDSMYCQVQVSDVGGEPNVYNCLSPPDCGGDPVDCTCLANEPCGFMCEATGPGFTLTCPGG